MRYSMKSLWILTAATALVFGRSAECVEIALEAELATEIVAPMAVAVPDDVDVGGKPNDPSRGKFIWAPGAPLVGGANGDKGYARYVVDIPEADTYVIFGYVVAWDGNSDSFWVVVNPADGNENAQATGNTQFRWGVAQGAVWHWDQINHWLDGGTFEREWDLDKGEAEIIIYTREDATMLDALYMTNELPVVQGKLPTDQDVEKQMGNLPVAPKGKLATTWANLKR